MAANAIHCGPWRAFGAAALAGFLVAGAARADVAVLKDGSRVEGEITRQTTCAVTLRLPYGAVTIPMKDVARIEASPSPQERFDAKLRALSPDDALGRAELARVARDRLFSTRLAHRLALEAWRIDPRCPEAADMLEELGDHLDGDHWVSAAQWYPEHGYVRREGRWVTTETAALLEAVDRTSACRKQLREAEGARNKARETIARMRDNEDALREQVAECDVQAKSLSAQLQEFQSESTPVTVDDCGDVSGGGVTPPPLFTQGLVLRGVDPSPDPSIYVGVLAGEQAAWQDAEIGAQDSYDRACRDEADARTEIANRTDEIARMQTQLASLESAENAARDVANARRARDTGDTGE